MTHIGIGTYCLTPAAGIDPNTGAVVVGLEAQLTQVSITGSLEVFDYNTNVDCPGAIEIITVASGAGSDRVAFGLVLT